MNLALYHPWLKSKGGAEKLLLEVMKRSSHDVTLYTLFYDEDETFAGFAEQDVRVLGSNKPPRGFLDKAVRFGIGSLLQKLPLAEHDKLVVSEAGLGSLITLRNHDIPVVCYCHTPLRAALPGFRETYRTEVSSVLRPLFDIATRVYGGLERRAWQHFDHVLANSALTEERILGKGLAREEAVSVVNPGVDVDAFQPGEFQHYFLYPSRLRRYKRQHLAIQAFKEADLDDFRLVLAGSPQEQDYVDELREMADGNDRIEIVTDATAVEWRDLYQNAYAVLFLAQQEDWGIVPLEGMAAGKPVIAVHEGGFTDVVEHGTHGLLVEAAVGTVADAMQELAQDEDRAREMGKAGRDAVQAYSWERFIERFDAQVTKG